ncbi:MAG: hypothetical protein OXF02_07445 [Simkaniaceae bacterium]|nr:hypothetical protein [Simkaniaceae bacterium]
MAAAKLVPEHKRGTAKPPSERAEYASACPKCGGDDRFVLWPFKGRCGRFWCRRCYYKGDGINFCRDQLGDSFGQALKRLGLDPRAPARADQGSRAHKRVHNLVGEGGGKGGYKPFFR